MIERGPVVLIGVDGPSGSGESTLARVLAAALDAPMMAERTVARASVVVVEGVTGTRAAGADQWSPRVRVEAPAAERLRRGVERDGAGHRDLRVEAIQRERVFFDADGAPDRAHLVVDGTTGAVLSERP